MLAPILFGAYRGYKKGFVLEVIAISSFVLAIIGGFKLLHLGMELLDEYFNISGEALPYLSFVLIFIGIILLVNAAGRIFKKVIDLTLLGALDNVAGALLSVLKWVFGISVLLWLSASFGLEPEQTWTADSLLYSRVLSFAPAVVDYATALIPFTHDLFEQIQSLLSGDTTAG